MLSWLSFSSCHQYQISLESVIFCGPKSLSWKLTGNLTISGGKNNSLSHKASEKGNSFYKEVHSKCKKKIYFRNVDIFIRIFRITNFQVFNHKYAIIMHAYFTVIKNGTKLTPFSCRPNISTRIWGYLQSGSTNSWHSWGASTSMQGLWGYHWILEE